MDYERISDGLQKHMTFMGDEPIRLTFRGTNIQERPTGVHARLFIIVNDVVYAWTYANVEKQDERTRLFNKAVKQMGPIEEAAFGKEEQKVAAATFDLFCLGLWDAWVGQYEAEEMEGDGEPTPLEFQLQPFVPIGSGVFLFAPPESAKSWMLMLMAVSIDAGTCRLWKVQQAKVLFINLERSAASVRRRLRAINVALGLPPTRPLLTINAKGRGLKSVYDAAVKSIEKHGVGVVVLDSISRAGLGKLTDDDTGNNAVDMLNAMCPTWIAIGHSPRSDDRHMFGSVHFDAGADVMVRQVKQARNQDELGVGLEITKGNDLPKVGMLVYRLTFDAFGLTGVERSSTTAFKQLNEKREAALWERIHEYLLQEGEATATQIAEAIEANRSSVAHELSSNRRFMVTRRDGKEVFYGTKIFREDYGT